MLPRSSVPPRPRLFACLPAAWAHLVQVMRRQGVPKVMAWAQVPPGQAAKRQDRARVPSMRFANRFSSEFRRRVRMRARLADRTEKSRSACSVASTSTCWCPRFARQIGLIGSFGWRRFSRQCWRYCWRRWGGRFTRCQQYVFRKQFYLSVAAQFAGELVPRGGGAFPLQ